MTKIPSQLKDTLTVEGKQRPDTQKILGCLGVGDKPTPEQIESVVHCCKLIDSGVGADEAIGQTQEHFKLLPSSLAKTEVAAVVQQELPEGQQTGIREVAQALSPEFPDVNEVLSDEAVGIVGAIQQACREELTQAVLGPESPIKPDPEKAVKLFREKLGRG